MRGRVRTAVLISGAGTNMEALVRAARAPGYPSEIVLVLSNRPAAGGLARAEALGVATAVVDHRAHPDRGTFERAVHAELEARDVELVALAGFMRVLTPWFVGRWAGRMVNIHPSLLPRYRGLNTHSRVLEAGDAEHGATVHWVSEDLDGGEIIAQAGFSVPPGATPDTLAELVRDVEHTLYPAALRTAAASLR